MTHAKPASGTSTLGPEVYARWRGSGLGAVESLATKFPRAKIIVDHLARPTISEGPPYGAAAALFSLNPFAKGNAADFRRVEAGQSES